MNTHPCQNRFAPDAACRMTRPALEYASRGWPVFPCRLNRTPNTKHGCYDASTNRKKIVAWWSAHPGNLIAMPTGEKSGIIAIDLDRNHAPGVDGWRNFYGLIKDIPTARADLEDTRCHKTARGGFHLLFQHPGEKVKSKNGAIAPGVDTKGFGGYIIMPPSRNETGEYSVKVDTDPAPLPPWLESLFREHKVMATGHGDTDGHGDMEDIKDIDGIESQKLLCGTPPKLSITELSITERDKIFRAIDKTLPQTTGCRNSLTFDLARLLKFDCGMDGLLFSELYPFVEYWYKKAKPVIRTKDWETTRSAFIKAWSDARSPLNVNLLDLAWEKVCKGASFPANPYKNPTAIKILNMCYVLHTLSFSKRHIFYFAMKDMGALLQIKSEQVSRWLAMVIEDGFLVIHKKGDSTNKKGGRKGKGPLRSNRYRWIGGDATAKK